MKTFLRQILVYICKSLLWLRYSIEIKGLDKINPKNLKKPGGVLFLPNHPAALVDPLSVGLNVFLKFPLRPLVVEYMYFTPGVHMLMKHLDALPIPDFESSNNSLKRKRHEHVISEVIKGLKSGKNFLLYPAGRLKHTSIEKLGGASDTHRIIQEAPEVNIVLVRVKGLWGSMFSRALTHKVPPLIPTLKKGLFILLKNLFFFTPRRKVTIEFYYAPEDFPYNATRLELNKWLENWYNQPDGLSGPATPGDSLKLVSHSFWKKDYPQILENKEKEEAPVIPLTEIDEQVQEKIIDKLVELTELNPSAISPEMSLSDDLGLDSLDKAELSLFIQNIFDTPPVPVLELTTVQRTMSIAAHKIELAPEEEQETYDLRKWTYRGKPGVATIGPGETIIEVFLNKAKEQKTSPACADSRSGILNYSRLKLGAIIFAEKIKKMPGKYIGIMLPASVGATLCVLACQLAGKVPLMINWTIGPKHLKAVNKLSKVQIVLTSWAFLERLDSVDLTGIDDKLVMIETVRRELTVFNKLKALLLSKLPTSSLMKYFGIDKLTKDDEAVLLFTSGTESMPKGVPLSHHNILSNQSAALKTIEIHSEDILLAFLPPFHSFGFCVTGLMGILTGFRTVFYPDPTDGKGLAKTFETWRCTIVCGAPTFLKGMLKIATKKQLVNMNLCVTGAEKTPPELFDILDTIDKRHTLIEGYGITECSPILVGNRPGMTLNGSGKALSNVELKVVHPETHKAVPTGSEGLLLARGPNVFSGYLNPNQQSPFIEYEGKEWYNTGDMAIIDQNECVTITGRKKRFIKVAGEMISLHAIESAIYTIAETKGWIQKEEGPSIALIAKETPGKRPYLLLITIFDTNTEEMNVILRKCGFSNLVRISDTVKVDEIPIMGTGKINYRVLEDEYLKEKTKTHS